MSLKKLPTLVESKNGPQRNVPYLLSNEDLNGLVIESEISSFSGKNVLLTGATGMVGAFLAETIIFGLQKFGLKPAEIVILARSAENQNLLSIRKSPNVSIVVTELSLWKPDRNFDYVIHAASPASPTQYGSSSDIANTNLMFLHNLFDSSQEVSRILFVSSGEVYGADSPVPIPESYVGSIDNSTQRAAYPIAKLAGEKLTISHPGGRVARLFHSFGPGVRSNDGRSFADFLWAASRNQDIVLRSAGADIRTFLYTQDSVAGMFKVLFADETSKTVNVGSTLPYSIMDFAKAVSEVSGSKIKFGKGYEDDYIPSPNQRIIPSVEILESLGWKQNIDLVEAIYRTLKWIKSS